MITCFAMDVDGVITDGSKMFNAKGEIIGKSFHDRDITALLALKDKGIRIVWLSGCTFANEAIAKARGFEFIKCREKVTELSRLNIPPEQLVYVGDDRFDIPALRYAGLSFCPADAPRMVRQAAKVICKSKAGCGVVQEVIWEHLYGQV